jgi:hypothetical protein
MGPRDVNNGSPRREVGLRRDSRGGRELEWGSVGAMGPDELGLLLMWLGCEREQAAAAAQSDERDDKARLLM